MMLVLEGMSPPPHSNVMGSLEGSMNFETMDFGMFCFVEVFANFCPEEKANIVFVIVVASSNRDLWTSVAILMCFELFSLNFTKFQNF